jgi:2-keto-4-pentenoate hydratase/2-oxohepta-3-ene-1,7-dioic acid hydratase in catechol pathway
MRLVRYAHEETTGIGLETDRGIVPTGFRTLNDVIAAGEAGLAAIRQMADGQPLERAKVLAPTVNPSKILFCGVNYAEHVKENPSAVLPTEPFIFAKLPSAVIGPGEPIVIPYEGSQVDWEVEMAVVIGKTARKVGKEEALDHVFGYTAVNDVSGRDIQFKDQQITLGKGIDTFCPMGPAVVTADELTDPSALTLTTRLNGEVMQQSATDRLIFDIGALIAYLSDFTALQPGDIIATGTPGGVGIARDPAVFMTPGDTIEVDVSAIGTLCNVIAQEASP